MAKQIVTKAEGEAYRIEADGSKIKLRVGDLIDDGARIITETGASVRFEDEKGVPLEIGENTGTILFSDAGPELSGTLQAAAPQDAPAKKTDAPTPNDAGAQNPLPSDSEGEDDSEAHSFVELPRIKYGSDINLHYERDVNVTDQIEGRASLNPRIKYSYNLSIDQEIQSYKDTRFPFDGGAKPFEPERPTAGDPPAPETDGTKAVTAEDTGITVDPLENFVTPAGVELTVTGAAAQHGTVEILPDGTLKYTPAPDWFGTDVVNCTSTDQSGRTYNSTVEVTVTPVIDTRDDDAGTVRENSAIDTDVTANDLFADHEGAKVVSVTDGKYGTVTINKDGTVKYTPAIDFLAEGETITDQYTYTVQTAAGNLESATVTVTITGTNDAPVVTAITGTATEDTTLTASGDIIAYHVTDADKTDTHAIVKVDGETSKVGTSVSGTYGSITVNADGTYTYTLNNGTNGDGGSSVQKLAEGEHYDEVFSVTVSDGHGGETTQNITITVHGTNDAPTAANNAGSVVEDDRTSTTEGHTTSDGNILANDNDIDNGASLSVSQVGGSAANVGTSVDGTYGKVTINADGTYKYDLNNTDPNVQALRVGQTVTDTFDVVITDEHGATVTETLTITITGTNDAPKISVGTGDSDSAALTETNASLTESGTLTLTDIDVKDSVSTVKVDSIVKGGTYAGTLPTDEALKNMLTISNGALTDSDTGGKINWNFNSGSEHFDSLAEGETLTLTYTVKSTDDSGTANDNDIHEITITITGTNSAPTLNKDIVSVIEDNGFTDDNIHDVATSAANIFDNDTDPDTNGKDLWKVNMAQGSSSTATAINTNYNYTDIKGTYGTLHLKQDGTYTYTLNSNETNVQELGHDAKVTDSFKIWMQDGNLPQNLETLTINISGTNDRPTIGVAAGTSDSAAADVIEGNIVPSENIAEATGTLTFSDIDLGDQTTVTKLANDTTNFKISGNTNGLISTRAELYDMLTLTDTTFTTTTAGGTNSHQLIWTFESGDERFNYLKAGETLTLTYKVEAKDDSGITENDTSKTQDIVITIKGSDSATDSKPSPDTGTVAEDQTLTVSGHHGTSGANQNLLYNDDSDGYITKFTVNGDVKDHSTGVKTAIYAANGTTQLGDITIKANGDYTFKPVKNYSGPVPQITYTTSDGKTSTLDITVTPVADKPTWETPAPSTDGREDAKIAMNLKLPTITDATDLNGTGNAGDHPERLGYITLENIGKATVYNGAAVLTATGGKITIAIVNDEGALDTNLHYTGLDISDANIVMKLTQAQFEALKIQQEAESGKNITGLKLSVTSYETNDSGVPISGLDRATGTKTFNVDVLAVTDTTPAITLGGSNSTPTESDLTTAITDGHITITNHPGATGTISATTEGGSGAIVIEEDCTMKIDADYLKASVSSTDTDGSEKYVVTVSGLAAGSVVNGVTAGADGTVTLTAETSVKSGSIDIFTSGLTITPPENFSGKMDGVTIKVETYDTDSDSSGTIAHNTAEMTLPALVVTPVVDGVDTIAVKQAVGDEDTYIALDIKPSSQDPNETFNVRISDIPKGATIKYGDAEYKCGNDGKLVHVDGTGNPAGITLEDDKIIINDFDTSKLSILPPKDSNADFVLKVEAQTVERDGIQVSDWADSPTLNLAVTVHSVADPVDVLNTALTPLIYTEMEAEANGIKLGKLIVKTADNTDGSEQVTLTVTNLAPEFTLAGSAVEFKGGEGTGRTWLVTMKQGVDLENTDAYIKTPANFSGKIEFSAQATNTDSTQDGTPDSSTGTSAMTGVAITVTPTPEATVNLSGAADEDALQQLSFAIQYQNGDTDETLNAVYIKASDADGTDKNFTIVYRTDGAASISLKDAVSGTGNGVTKETIDGIEYYKIVSADGKGINNIFVKGDAQYSGKGEDNSFDIKYEVNDSHYGDKDTATGAVTETTITDGTYHVTFKPVTDQTTMKAVAAGDINVGDSGEITLSGTTVTVGTGSANSFSVDVTVNAPADVDGSEHFIKLIVDGVPDGVSVKGAKYLGDSGAVEGTGRWLLTVDDGKFFDSSHGITTTLDFTVDRDNPNIWGLHEKDAVKVTVTAVSQDEMGSMKGDEAASSTTAEFGIKIDFGGPGTALADVPAPGINITKGAGTEEDSGECTLGNFIKAEYQIDTDKSQGQTEYRFSFEINGLPKGTVVSGDAVGGSVTIKEGGSVTVSGFGNQAAMQSVLDNIKVTLPPDYNDNSDGVTTDGMNLDVTWKTDGWDLNGGDGNVPVNNGNVQVVPEVKPVTDPMEIKIELASDTINENQPGEAGKFSFTVRVGEGNDGGYGNVLNEGRLFLKLDGARESDTITYGDTTYTLTDVADGTYSGITPGKYYVIENVKAGDVLALAYQPADYYSGNIKVTATIVSKETGATNEIAASGNSELTVNPVNSAYKFTVDDAAANENGTADLTISPSGGHDNDGSEKIHSVVLSGVDAEHSDYFIVKYTVDGAEKTAAKVAAGKDAEGQHYEWVLSTDSAGNLPADIKITGLNHYSGTQDLKLTVVTGETALGTGKENSYDFSLTFHPTADGFSDFTPTLTFGKAGEYIDLNLNAMVNDTSGTGSETATVTLKDLGDGASFFIARDTNGDGTADSYVSVTTAYEGGKYTLSGIALDEINDIKILSPNVGKKNVTVDAWTVEPDAQSGYGESTHISADVHCGNKFDITVSAAAPTSGADRLIYGGDAGTYDGGDGTDTLYLANFRETANSAKNDINFKEAATIKNIEIIDMSDGAHSLTNVTADAVKNMTDANNTLRIMGGNDDKIELSDGWVKGADTSDGWRTYTNGEATINVDGDVKVTINGIASMSLMMAMAFAPLAAAAEPAIMPDSLAGYDFSSDFGAAAASGSPAFSLTAEGMIDFSSLTHSSFGTLDMENASAQSLYHVDPYGVYGVTDGSHELTVTGTELDSVSLADSAEAAWGAPELSADGSHYSYTATGDFDHDAATPDDTVTLNVSRQIYDDTLAYDAHAMNDGGLGDDTLTFGHEDSTVDFSGGAASHIANIEKFDLGDGSHTLENLTAKDVFDMTDARGTLTINGDNADHVTLSDVLDDATDGMWESSPFQSVESGVSYSVYTGSFEGHMVTLKIEDEIIQQLTTHTKG